jgi:hypothetical protein
MAMRPRSNSASRLRSMPAWMRASSGATLRAASNQSSAP